MNELLFYLSAFLTVAGALLVVFVKNIIHACVYLLMSFMGVAGLYLTLDAEFVAATQVVVYIGGVVVLMLFAIMLTGGANFDTIANRFGLKKVPSMGNLRTYILSLALIGILGISLWKIIGLTPDINDRATQSQKIGFVASDLGASLVQEHVIPFEVSSLILLGALMGAAIIARPRREGKNGPTKENNKVSEK